MKSASRKSLIKIWRTVCVYVYVWVCWRIQSIVQILLSYQLKFSNLRALILIHLYSIQTIAEKVWILLIQFTTLRPSKCWKLFLCKFNNEYDDKRRHPCIIICFLYYVNCCRWNYTRKWKLCESVFHSTINVWRNIMHLWNTQIFAESL